MRRAPWTLLAAAAVCFALTACSDQLPAPIPEDTASPAPGDPRTQLAAMAAGAKDLHVVAAYTLKVAGKPDRNVTAMSTANGDWRLDLTRQALGGTVDVALLRVGGVLYQCALPAAGCVRLTRIASAYDPHLQHLFTDWLDVFMDRQAALSVSIAQALPGVAGTCFAVDSSAVSVSSPVDAGIYCYGPGGMLTGARTKAGSLILVGNPTPAPPSITLPGAVSPGQPLPNASPSPSPSPSASGTPSGKPSVTPATHA
ncbi:hypothetical protein [Hamadaea tsunoensis]|uniref:hypothetical protein n=1 Tax=Hamadaea tsunoensis TaxID=53368 RepID=UPI0004067086|nr:hypothetical protein [Hamadaea tsunoensis]